MMNKIFFRIFFILTLNIFIFLTISFNINFLYLTLNLLIIFFIYELEIQKKKIEKINNENNFDLNFIPASEHPIIKAAKKRLKKLIILYVLSKAISSIIIFLCQKLWNFTFKKNIPSFFSPFRS